MQGTQRLGLFAAGLAGAMGLGACGGGDSSGTGANTTISQAEAAAIGGFATEQIGAATSGLTSFSVSGGGFTGGLFSAPKAAGGALFRLYKALPVAQRGHLADLLAPGGCDPTVAGDSSDADGNGIDANATYTFTTGTCTIILFDTATNTTSTLGLTGAVHIQDNTTGSVLFGYGIQFTNLRYTESVVSPGNPTQTISFATNGTLGADVLATIASTSQNISYGFDVNRKRAYTMSWNWDIGFDPAVGVVIDTASSTLPAGAIDIQGSFGWNGSFGQADGDWGFTLNTTAPLGYDGSCQSDPPFDSGVVELIITANSSAGATATYSGCGTPPTIQAYGSTP